ncbi:MAG: HipA N-terminal domain-containing protein [Pseudomonadota bacterium]
MNKNNSAKVYYNDVLAGKLKKENNTYVFIYDVLYLNKNISEAISLSLPLKAEAYKSAKLFPFFTGLIPEGWLLKLNSKTLKIDPDNHFDMLLEVGKDCIGAVKVIREDK